MKKKNAKKPTGIIDLFSSTEEEIPFFLSPVKLQVHEDIPTAFN